MEERLHDPREDDPRRHQNNQDRPGRLQIHRMRRDKDRRDHADMQDLPPRQRDTARTANRLKALARDTLMGYDKAKTTKIDLRKQFCRCILHNAIVDRTTGNKVPESLRRAVEEILPLTEDLCDRCLKEGKI